MANEQHHSDARETGDAVVQKAMQYYCQYLVGLAALSQPLDSDQEPEGRAHCFFCSGFVVSIEDQWLFVTAGHILKEIEDGIRKGKAAFRDFRLVDRYGPQGSPKDYVPYDYEGARKIFRVSDIDGVDFGVVTLTSYYRKLLEANGIVAVTEEEIMEQEQLDFSLHFVLGLPSDSIERSVVENSEGYVVGGKASPTAIFLTKLDELPDDCRKTNYPRFVGKLPDEQDVGDIKGMSGGPIFGFSQTQQRHGIVAVQSSWLRNRKILFGCPTIIVAQLVKEGLDL